MSGRIIVVLIALSISGCASKSPDDPSFPREFITGTVTLDGRPLAMGVILLERTDHSVATRVGIMPDGSFKAQSLDGTGLPLGDYRVAVSLRDINAASGESISAAPLTDGSKTGGVVVPVRYQRLDTSDLVITVKPGENPPVKFDLVQ